MLALALRLRAFGDLRVGVPAEIVPQLFIRDGCRDRVDNTTRALKLRPAFGVPALLLIELTKLEVHLP